MSSLRDERGRYALGMPGRSLRPRRPARSREATRFIAATLLSFDVLLTAFSLWDLGSSVRNGLISFLEIWDVGKSGVALVVLSVIALRTRSLSLGVFAAILGVITMLEGTGAHDAFATWILDRLGIASKSIQAGVRPHVYAELLILSTLAVCAAIAIWLSRRRERDLAFMRRHLLLLLVALWVFAVGLDYVASLTGAEAWRLVEEGGERAVMSIFVGYVLGIRLARASDAPR